MTTVKPESKLQCRSLFRKDLMDSIRNGTDSKEYHEW